MPPHPVTLTADSLAAMLNLELADHPVYDGLELQWFDDETHGTGMLAFLSRRADRSVDYYAAPGLRLDRDGYRIGGGTRSWNEAAFDVARLAVADDGVDAEARFVDVDGREIHVRVDDRDGRRRRRARFLAPVGSGIEDPGELLLVWMPAFDLVHASGRGVAVTIDGVPAATGRLPGQGLHRRVLVKYAAPVLTLGVAREHDGPLADLAPGLTEPGPDGVGGSGVAAVLAQAGDGAGALGQSGGGAGPLARLAFSPAFPDVTALPDGASRSGRWDVSVDGWAITGGVWDAARTGDVVDLGLDVTQRWRPRRLPPLMRVVTSVVPVFRRWPTTYRWRATVTLGAEPRLVGRWERTSLASADDYRTATGSAGSAAAADA